MNDVYQLAIDYVPGRSACQGMTNRRRAITLIEILFVMSIIVLLTTTIYQVLKSVNMSYVHARNKLDILQTTRLIMAGLRNELRNAIEKPQGDGPNTLIIPVSPEKAIVYHFDSKTRRLYKGEQGPPFVNMTADVADMKPFMFDDGQIMGFDYDSSYRDANAFAESELALNSKVWCKVTMRILYSEKFKDLSEKEKEKILNSPDDPRVKSFFMMISPRRINWLLQATQ